MITLAEYIEMRGRGAVAEIVRESRVSRSTVERAAAGLAITRDPAKAIAAVCPDVDVHALMGL